MPPNDELRFELEGVPLGNSLLESLTRVALEIGDAQTVDQLCGQLAVTLRATGFRGCGLLLNGDGETLRVAFLSETPELTSKALALLGVRLADFGMPVHPVFSRCIHDRISAFVPNPVPGMQAAFPAPLRAVVPALANLLRIEKAIVAPLAAAEHVLGIFVAHGPNLGREDIPAVALFAGHVALALTRTELLARAREAEARYRELFEAAPDGIFSLDLRGRVTESNPAADQILGRALAGEQLALEELFPPASRSRVRESLWAGSVGEGASAEVPFLRPDQQRRILALRFAPILRGTDVVGVHGWVRDVTEEKELAQEAACSERLRALGQLAAGVAHDFNNILAGILGNAQLLLMTVQDPDIRHRLSLIERSALRGADIVHRVFELTRAESGAPFEPLDVEGLLRDAASATRREWRDQALTRGVQIDMIIQAGDVPRVAGNATELRDALTNLILNAVEAMPAGGQITLAAEEDGGQVRIEVRDTGLGMTEEVLQRAMEPFFTTKAPAHSGLGLSVAYGVISRHRGRLELRSVPGQGTSCVIWLPRASDTEMQAAGAEGLPPDGSSPDSGR